jgi:hypothetical protein
MDSILGVTKAVLQTTPARWESLARSLPIEALNQVPAPGEWSALACLQHLIETEQLVFPLRVKALLEGRDFTAFNPEAQGEGWHSLPDAQALAAQFGELRRESLRTLTSVSESDLARTARHQELGLVSMSELLHEWAGHDLMHTVQAERALMQPFIRGCGPWKPYFADHVAMG